MSTPRGRWAAFGVGVFVGGGIVLFGGPLVRPSVVSFAPASRAPPLPPDSVRARADDTVRPKAVDDAPLREAASLPPPEAEEAHDPRGVPESAPAPPTGPEVRLDPPVDVNDIESLRSRVTTLQIRRNLVTCGFSGSPAAEALAYVGQAGRVNLVIDQATAFDDCARTPIHLEAKDEPVEEVLSRLLQSLPDLEFVVRGNVVVVRRRP